MLDSNAQSPEFRRESVSPALRCSRILWLRTDPAPGVCPAPSFVRPAPARLIQEWPEAASQSTELGEEESHTRVLMRRRRVVWSRADPDRDVRADGRILPLFALWGYVADPPHRPHEGPRLKG